ncbi:5-(carboxyamino)imidazole ribonucleotide synthase [Plastoroseomonas arctica]|uniref:N5-carboxyaminoimidazole ribonucleotide synthase n=1 Tax=Plastoroseomonas arctica TaxID=1509237 RepID=A0AAF1JW22_9PROT|nr:5-(carboxyamino)imidazole ribonucleotide synthase [Plastoroseomonas arctica]MBR0655006.1 5-(carboxyamino)imidazole ribonucleotide synthase [Plastoroseomonas arctica]
MKPTGLPPNATIGILGGGQLGRMSALAAARLGYRTHVFAPEADQPAMQVATRHSVADYTDEAALVEFARAVDAVTFEFENVPARTLDILGPLAPCHPSAEVLAICQDRVAEKRFMAAAGIPTAPWRSVDSAAELAEAVAEIGLPAVLKTTRLGYDGRGQAVLRDQADIAPAWTRLAPRPLILEGFIPFAMELSVIVARDADGATAVFDIAENRHHHHILDITFAPARIPESVALEAQAHARRLAEALGLVGVAALELFLLADATLLGNEIAPRPHNSGHWTIEACCASQFEQHIRAVAGLPLADPSRHHDAVMRNLVGPEGMALWSGLLTAPRIVPHLYGKAEPRPGRKMGHATWILPFGTLATMADEEALSGFSGV